MTQIYQIMQREKNLLLLAGAILLFGIVSCKKESEPSSHDPNTLPLPTKEGKNTFGCKVNGKVWVAYAPFTAGGTIALEGNYDAETGSFILEGTQKNNGLNVFETIGIGANEVLSAGYYNTPIEDNDELAGFLDYYENHSCSKYYYRSELLNEIEITYLNPSQRIISGTFQMDLINPSCIGDTIKIREGRFDWRF